MGVPEGCHFDYHTNVLAMHTSHCNLTQGTNSGAVDDVVAVLADLYPQWMRPSRECLVNLVHKLSINTLQGLSKGFRDTLFLNLFFPFKVQSHILFCLTALDFAVL